MRLFHNPNLVGWVALLIGVLTAVTPMWATTTPIAGAAAIGLGALTAVYAMWSLIARDPTKDHWALSVVGLILFLSPWVGGFATAGAVAWVAWIAGLATALLGGFAYVQDEAADRARKEVLRGHFAYLRQYGEGTPANRQHALR